MSKYFLFFLLALTLHLSIIALSVFDFSKEVAVSVKPKETSVIMEAIILDENIITAKAKELKQRQENKSHLQEKQQKKYARKLAQEKQQLQQLKKQRQQAEKATKKQAKQERKKLQAIKREIALEQKKQQKILRQYQAERKKRAIEEKRQAKAKQEAKHQAEKAEQQKIAKKRKIAAEKRRKAEEALDFELKQEEELNEQQAEDAKIAKQAIAKAAAIDLIKHKITQNWIQPSSILGKLKCTISIELIPGGGVTKAKVVGSSGNPLFDRSAERAAYKASPLPVPKDANIFKHFRKFKLEFDPE